MNLMPCGTATRNARCGRALFRHASERVTLSPAYRGKVHRQYVLPFVRASRADDFMGNFPVVCSFCTAKADWQYV